MKCPKCCHFYRVMAKESGYNPFPCCQLYEDTGRHPNVLTQDCFESREKPKKKKSNETQKN